MSKPIFFLSVYNKDRYESFVQDLDDLDEYQLAGTEGTAEWCQQLGIECRPITELFDMPPRLDGQVKTLHPDLYSALLATSSAELEDGIQPIRGVLVDLTPFQEGGQFRRKKIDIGGVSLLRAAAKNYQHVVPLADWGTAKTFIGTYPPSEHAREWLASQALKRTLRYDKELLGELDQSVGNGDRSIHCSLPAEETLRYGENPSQTANYRSDLFGDDRRAYDRVVGDELSYTNLLDVNAARQLIDHGKTPQVSVIKHTNPTGWARGDDLVSVVEQAWEGDPKSAFGGVVGVNRTVTCDVLGAVDDYFVEAMVAPKFTQEVVDRVRGEDRPRLVEYDDNGGESEVLRSLSNDYLTQTALDPFLNEPDWETVTERPVPEDQIDTLKQMWRLCRWVTSNAAVIGTHDRVLGVGAGQQSRVDAVRIAVQKLNEHHPGFEGPLMMASDGFFPFPDNIELAGEAGVDAVISPGGSVKDDEVIAEADDREIAMVFTGQRVFHH